MCVYCYHRHHQMIKWGWGPTTAMCILCTVYSVRSHLQEHVHKSFNSTDVTHIIVLFFQSITHLLFKSSSFHFFSRALVSLLQWQRDGSTFFWLLYLSKTATTIRFFILEHYHCQPFDRYPKTVIKNVESRL